MLPYLRLLIRQRLSAWNPASHRGEKGGAPRTFLRYFAFCLGMLSLYGLLVALEYFVFGAFAQIGEPETMLALTGVFCVLMTLVSSFFYVFNELFFSRDVALVSALPITSRQILTAKLVRIWLGEALIALAVCLPAAILYGLRAGRDVLYYLNALLLIPFLPIVPLMLVTVASFLLIRMSALWKRREALTVLVSLLFVGVILWAQMMFSMSAEDDIHLMILQLITQQRRLLDQVVGLYPPIRWFVAAFTGSTWSQTAQGLWFALGNAGAFVAAVFLLGGGYQRLAIRQQETLAHLNASARKRGGRQAVRTPLMAFYRRELREIFTVPVYATNCLATAVVFPVIAGVMILGANSAQNELSMLPLLIALAPKTLMTAIAAALFALTAGMNMAVSTAVSREGKRHEFFRTLPVRPQTQILAKLLMGLTLNLISALPMAILGMIVLPALRLSIGLGWVAALPFSTAVTVLGLMVDANHPKFLWKNETEAIKQNGLAALSMFAGMALLAACGGAVYGLTVLGMSLGSALTVFTLCALAADGILFARLMQTTANHYLQQEVLN